MAPTTTALAPAPEKVIDGVTLKLDPTAEVKEGRVWTADASAVISDGVVYTFDPYAF